jgi:hypothetical protein
VTQHLTNTIKPLEASGEKQEYSGFVQWTEAIQAPKAYSDEANGNQKRSV